MSEMQRRTGGLREQRLARLGQRRARAAAVDRDARKAARHAAFSATAELLTQRLVDAGWSDVTVKQAGAELVVAGKDPQGNAHAAHGEDADACVATLIGIGEGTQPAPDQAALAASPAADPPASTSRTITLGDVVYAIAPADALKITGAMWQVLSRREAEVTLASGQALVLTAETIDDVMQQLAGAAGETEGA